MPAVLGTPPPEAKPGAALLVISKVVKNQPLFTAGRHEYVHWNINPYYKYLPCYKTIKITLILFFREAMA